MFSVEFDGNCDFSKTCRLCSNETNDLVSIFHKNLIEEKEILLSEMVMQCASIQIFEDDELPKGVCKQCIERLNNAYHFRKLCENSEHNFYLLLNKLEDKSNNVVIKTEYPIDIVEENLQTEKNETISEQNTSNSPSEDTLKGTSRGYKRKSNRGNWSLENLKQAIYDISQGQSIRKAAKKYGIPMSTVRRKIQLQEEDRYKKLHMGGLPTFTEEQEEELTEKALKLANTSNGLTPLQLRKLAYEYAEKNSIKNKFNKNTKTAGTDWYYWFLKRHPEIRRKRKSQM